MKIKQLLESEVLDNLRILFEMFLEIPFFHENESGIQTFDDMIAAVTEEPLSFVIIDSSSFSLCNTLLNPIEAPVAFSLYKEDNPESRGVVGACLYSKRKLYLVCTDRYTMMNTIKNLVAYDDINRGVRLPHGASAQDREFSYSHRASSIMRCEEAFLEVSLDRMIFELSKE